MAVYLSVLKPGDVIMGMSLAAGGHLSHGHKVNFSGILFEVVHYGVNRESEMIDYDELLEMAEKYKPKMIIAGASAYPREIDFKKMGGICEHVGAFLCADIAHIAGLIVAGLHQSPLPFAEFVTTTTHKTLRGPRGGAILCKKEYAEAIDRMVFPGIQGGPLMHVIAAKAVAFKEALSEEFIEYQRRIVKNAKALAKALKERGLRLVSGGTDNHLLLVDLRPLTGAEAEAALEEVGITVNKNSIPFDPQKPAITSGIRIGTPALTTRGMGEEEMEEIAEIISSVLGNIGTAKEREIKEDAKKRIRNLCERFPLYGHYP
jgi:glycine hydroxymethyltransferase